MRGGFQPHPVQYWHLANGETRNDYRVTADLRREEDRVQHIHVVLCCVVLFLVEMRSVENSGFPETSPSVFQTHLY